jgi:hypothetical protein
MSQDKLKFRQRTRYILMFKTLVDCLLVIMKFDFDLLCYFFFNIVQGFVKM